MPVCLSNDDDAAVLLVSAFSMLLLARYALWVTLHCSGPGCC